VIDHDQSKKNEEFQIEFITEAIERVIAGESVETALQIDKKVTESFYSIGYSFYQQSNYEEALRYFKYSVMLDNYEVKYLIAYAKCLKNIGELDEAISYLTIAQLLSSNDPTIALVICECLLKKNLVDEAGQILEMIESHFKNSEEHKQIVELSRGLKKIADNETIKNGLI